MTRIITLTSAVCAVGKTTISINLATRLVQRGLSVCLMDAGTGPETVDRQLALQPGLTLKEMAHSQAGLDELLAPSPPGFDVISLDAELEWMTALNDRQLQKLFDSIGELQHYDVLLVDLCVASTPEMLAFALASPEVVLVLTPDPATMRDNYQYLKKLQSEQFAGTLQLLVNRLPEGEEDMEVFDKFREVAGFYLGINVPLLASLHEQSDQQGLMQEQLPLLVSRPHDPVCSDIDQIASSVQESLATTAGVEIREYFKKYLELINKSEDNINVTAVFKQASEDSDKLDQQLDSLAFQVDKLIGEMSRLRKTGPVDLCNWIETSCHRSEITSRVEEGYHYPVYVLQQSGGGRLRFACHSIDDGFEEHETQTNSS